MKAVDTLFGDKGKAASKAQSKQNEQSRQFILEQTQKAQNLLQQMYPQMQQNTMQGANSVLKLLQQNAPAQANVYQQGTNNAISALMGGQLNPVTPDFSAIQNAQIPNYQTYQQAPQNMMQAQPQQNQNMNSQIAQILARGGR